MASEKLGFIDKEIFDNKVDISAFGEQAGKMNNIGKAKNDSSPYWNIDVEQEYGNIGISAYVVQRKLVTAIREIDGEDKSGYSIMTEIINLNGQNHYIEEEFHQCQASNYQTYDVWVRKGQAMVPSLGKFADAATTFRIGSWVKK